VRRDYRDAVIEELTLCEAELLDRVVDLEVECDAYRRLVQQLLHRLHEVTLERDVLRGQLVINRRREEGGRSIQQGRAA
jgi:hypothetical protein